MLKGRVLVRGKVHLAVVVNGTTWRSRLPATEYTRKTSYATLVRAGKSVSATFVEVVPALFVTRREPLNALTDSTLRLLIKAPSGWHLADAFPKEKKA